MNDSVSACRHDLSELSTLTVTIRLWSLQSGLGLLRCSVCGRQLVVEQGHPAWFSRSAVKVLWRSESSAFEAAVPLNSWLTGNSSSSPAPTPAAPVATSGKADLPLTFRESTLSKLDESLTPSKPSLVKPVPPRMRTPGMLDEEDPLVGWLGLGPTKE